MTPALRPVLLHTIPRNSLTAAAKDAVNGPAGHNGLLVLGSQDDKAWAVQSLPKGVAMYPRETLLNGIMRQRLDRAHGAIMRT